MRRMLLDKLLIPLHMSMKKSMIISHMKRMLIKITKSKTTLHMCKVLYKIFDKLAHDKDVVRYDYHTHEKEGVEYNDVMITLYMRRMLFDIITLHMRRRVQDMMKS